MSLGLIANCGHGIYIARPLPHGSVGGYRLLCVFLLAQAHIYRLYYCKTKKGCSDLFVLLFSMSTESIRAYTCRGGEVGGAYMLLTPVYFADFHEAGFSAPWSHSCTTRVLTLLMEQTCSKTSTFCAPTLPLVFNITVREAGTGETHYCYAGKSRTARFENMWLAS